MKRRSVLTAVAGAPLLASAQTQPGREDAYEGRPNFLFVLFDKCRRDGIGAYGRTDVHSPNIDRLAQGGVRFNNCYAPQPLCGPARASIITGQYPHRHGMRKNTYPYARTLSNNVYHESIPDPFGDPRFDLWDNFPHFLNVAGYRSAHIGKWHLGPANPGFFDIWKSFNSQILHWVGQPHKSPYRHEVHTDLGIEFIEQNADRPFFLYQSYYSPHEPNDPPKQFRDLFRGKNVDHDDYYASISALDWNVGRLVEALKRKNLLDRTFIIITTEHGRTWIDRPGTLAGMSIAYDEAARLPLIMHCPALLPEGAVWESGVSLVDLMPTIMHAANVVGRGGRDYADRSLLPDLQEGRDEWRRQIVIQNISQQAIQGSNYEERALRTERWKLILRKFDVRPQMRVDELYDMKADPEETRNLYAARTDVVRELATALQEWGEENEDALAIELGRRSSSG